MHDGPSYGGLHPRVASIVDDVGLRSALLRVVTNVVELLTVPASASVTVIEQGDQPATLAGTDAVAIALDDAQYLDGDGPCLSAARTSTVVRVDELPQRASWPSVQAASRHHDVHSSLSVPLSLSGAALGSMNVYSVGAATFTMTEERIATTFAAHASVIAVNAQAYWAAFDGTRDLTVALQARSLIDLARGILIATRGIDADDAFHHLSSEARRSGRPLHAVASDVVARAERGGGDRGEGR